MTKKKLALGVGLIALCLLVCLCVAMCAPASETPAEESVATVPSATVGNTTRNYTIEIKNVGDQPLEEIGVYIYTDSTMQELVWFAKTDAQGCLSFQDVASDSFVAVLDKVPAGYLVEEFYPLTGENTQIVLESGLMEGDLSKLNYKLGDLMMDFTAVDPEGKEYKFSELLKEKKAIVLNFWYLQCEPCKSEFPYLQEAYEKYDEDVLVLAMNPINTDDAEIAQFQKEKGYTFPMMKCDNAWEKAMGITAYPTTVVIDRFGNICMIHTGSVTEAETFENIFKFFSAGDYKQTFVKNMEELEEAAGIEQTVGTKDNPVEMGVTASFQMEIGPGHEMHYNIYRITGTVYLSVNDKDISVLHNGKTYNAPFSIPLTSEGTSTVVPLVFTNKGTETKIVTVTMGRAAGTYGNPYSLELEEFTANVGAGNQTGVYYTYTAEKTGLFKITVKRATAGVDYNIVAYNLTSYAYRQSQDNARDEETGCKYVAVNVTKGDKIQVIVGTLPDSSNSYPAASFDLKAEILEGQSEGTAQQTLTAYSVNVTDENRNPVPNVTLNMKVDQTTVNMKTNENGSVVSKQKPGAYPVVLTVPDGYTAKTTEFTLTEEYPSMSIKLDKNIVEEETYTVKVMDAAGIPIEGAMVSVGTGYGKTDATGTAVITTAKGTYTAQIVADGYNRGEISVSPENKNVSICLVAGEATEKMTYTVHAVDYYGNALSNVTLTVKQNGAVLDVMTTGADGVAEVDLAAGTYEIGVTDGWYADADRAVLTEDAPSATLRMIRGVSGEVGSIYGDDTDILTLGATFAEGLQANADNYFLFVPEVDGVYRFTGIESDATISYFGNNTAFLMDLTASTDYNSVTNSFTLNIKPGNLGSSYILGLKQDTWGVIVIERIGDAILDITDMEETPYERKNTLISNFSLSVPGGKRLKYVDVQGGNVTYVKGSDGYYHLNSATGPVLYVNLSDTAPYLAMSKCMGITDEHAVYKLVYVYYDSDGVAVKKEIYNQCMIEYVKASCPDTGVYPLNDDLIFMFQQSSTVKGWGDYDSFDYLFYDENREKMTGINEDIAWMYAVCYLG